MSNDAVAAPEAVAGGGDQRQGRRSQRRAAFSDWWWILRSWDQLALVGSFAPRLLTAPLAVLEAGAQADRHALKGNERMKWF